MFPCEWTSNGQWHYIYFYVNPEKKALQTVSSVYTFTEHAWKKFDSSQYKFLLHNYFAGSQMIVGNLSVSSKYNAEYL